MFLCVIDNFYASCSVLIAIACWSWNINLTNNLKISLWWLLVQTPGFAPQASWDSNQEKHLWCAMLQIWSPHMRYIYIYSEFLIIDAMNYEGTVVKTQYENVHLLVFVLFVYAERTIRNKCCSGICCKFSQGKLFYKFSVFPPGNASQSFDTVMIMDRVCNEMLNVHVTFGDSEFGAI